MNIKSQKLNSWHSEKKGAVDKICRQCKSEAWWINPYWACFKCDLRWDGYFVDKKRNFANNQCGVYCCLKKPKK